MTFDIYRGKKDTSLRMATLLGAGLPNHVDAKDWKLVASDPIEVAALSEDIAEDIEARGFSFYKLV
jgi:hypothetical protein